MEIAFEILTMGALGWLLGQWIYPKDMLGGAIGAVLGFMLSIYSLYRRNQYKP